MKNNNLNWRDRRSLKNVSKDAKIQLTDGTFLDAIAIAKIVDMAPEDLDTMKEIADWISNHEEEVVSILEGLDSKADKGDVEALAEVVETKATKDEVNSKYSKPTGGIPKSDLTTSVQSSLNKADTALQSHQDISNLATKTEVNAKYTKPSSGIPKTDLNSTVQASLNKADSALQNHQDISHLATKEEVENKLSEINNTKLDVNLNTITKIGEDRIKELVNADEMYNNASNAIIVANNQIKEVSKLKNDVETYIGAGKEQVVVSITSSVEGVSVEGLTLYVYLNNAETPFEATTDEHGMATFRVDTGYQYRIVFPLIAGCAQITDVTHTAGIAWRNIEVDYSVRGYNAEKFTAKVIKWTGNQSEKFEGCNVHITIDEVTTEYHCDANGEVSVHIPIGKEYSVAFDKIDDLYTYGEIYNYSFTANSQKRELLINYRDVNIGIFIVANDLAQYTKEQWILSGRPNEEAKFIKIATNELVLSGNTFGIDIDSIAYNKRNETIRMTDKEISNPFMNGGISIKGLKKSNDFVNLCAEHEITSPVFALCQTLNYGNIFCFVGSVGQHQAIRYNNKILEELVSFLRPDRTNTIDDFIKKEKWTIDTNSLITNVVDFRMYVYSNEPIINIDTSSNSNYYFEPFYVL